MSPMEVTKVLTHGRKSYQRTIARGVAAGTFLVVLGCGHPDQRASGRHDSSGKALPSGYIAVGTSRPSGTVPATPRDPWPDSVGRSSTSFGPEVRRNWKRLGFQSEGAYREAIGQRLAIPPGAPISIREEVRHGVVGVAISGIAVPAERHAPHQEAATSLPSALESFKKSRRITEAEVHSLVDAYNGAQRSGQLTPEQKASVEKAISERAR